MGPEFVVLSLILIPQVIDTVAQLLQRSWIGRPLPQELQGIYDEAEYATSNAYTRDKSTMGLVHDAFDLVVFITFWFAGGFGYLQERCKTLGWSDPSTGLAYFAVLFVVNDLISIPWSLYSTFVIEERYGFNNTSCLTFTKDKLKAYTLTVALGGPLLYIVLWFFSGFGSSAWLYAWLALSVFQVVMFFLAPVLLLPLFLQMEPLPEGIAVIFEGLCKKGPRKVLNRILYQSDNFEDKLAFVTKDRQGKPLCLFYWNQHNSYVLASGASPKEAMEAGTLYAKGSGNDILRLTDWTLEALVGHAALAVQSSPLLASDGKDNLQVKIVQVGTLRTMLLALAQSLQYNCTKMFVIDGSTRSAHSNAFCTGFGNFRRICLFDTLLAQMTLEEITAVVGHEIGHDKLYHTIQGLFLGLCLSFVMFFSMGRFIEDPYLAEAFFLPEPSVYAGLVIFSVVWGVLEFFISIPITVNSRCNEYAADRFAIEADEKHAKDLAGGLTKLTKNSKSNLTPHPFFVFLHHSHPPLDVRLAAMSAHHAKVYGKA